MARFGLGRRALKAAAVAALVGSAGMAAGAGSLYAFSPPPGWQQYFQARVAGNRGGEVWRGPVSDGFAENVLVMVRPTNDTLAQVADTSQLQKQLPGGQAHLQDTTVCGGHPAKYAYVVAPWHGKTLISEQILSVWNKVAYVAVYSRLSEQPVVEAARSSLVTLCPGGSQPLSTSW